MSDLQTSSCSGKEIQMQELNVVPMFCSEGRYLYAQIAVGDAASPKPFYHGLHETIKSTDPPCIAHDDDLNCNPTDDPSSGMEVTKEANEGMKNLDIMIDTIEKMEAKGMEVINQAIAVKDKFIADVSCRLRSNDINYALGITKFFSTFRSSIKVNQQLQQHLNWRHFSTWQRTNTLQFMVGLAT